MIVDASVLLSAFFAEETQIQAQALLQNYAAGHIELVAPTLLSYEVTNAVWQAVRRGRIDMQQAEGILTAFENLAIAQEPVAWKPVLLVAQQFNRSTYDASYLALAQSRQDTFITGDLRLYRAVQGELGWVHWIGDYRA